MTLTLALLYIFPILSSVAAIFISHTTARKLFGAVVAIGGAVVSGLVVGYIGRFWTILLGMIAVIQLLNCLRLVENRMNLQHLKSRFFKTWVWTVLGTALLLTIVLAGDYGTIDFWIIARYLSVVGAILASIFLAATVFHIYSTRPVRLTKHRGDMELPTLSVLVPARNEDDNLVDCIHSLLRSDYPKLEVIVLDDCSHDKSSDIIRSFAHKGVRFIQGEYPKEKWLAKNQAYQTLADAASGDWLLFSGVDVRFEPKTLRNIVTHALNKNRLMLGLLPIRSRMTWKTAWLSPLRYWYEMALPRTLFGAPPVLSTCWLIEKDAFNKLGGFNGVTRSVIPETYFAKNIHKLGRYQFIRSSLDLVIHTEKSLTEQYQTALRTRYPQTRKSIELSSLVICLYVALLFSTYLLSLLGVMYNKPTVAITALVGSILLSTSHVLITYVTCRKALFISFLTFPYLLLQEAVLLAISLYKYEFSTVDWKGRNICYPIMHITPKLPDID